MKNRKWTGESLIFTFFIDHKCPVCNEVLDVITEKKIVNYNSPEAKDYDFYGYDARAYGDVEFSWNAFACDACGYTGSIKEVKEIERQRRRARRRDRLESRATDYYRDRLRITLIFAFMPLFIMFNVGIFHSFILQVSSSRHEMNIDMKQYPLHSINKMIVDEKGNIYLSLSSYSAIQMYNDEGKIIRRVLFSNTSGTSFDFQLDDQDHICITPYNGDVEHVFSEDGYLGTESLDSRATFRIGGPVNPVIANGKAYYYRSLRKVIEVYYEENNKHIDTIVLDAPKWPWAFSTYFFVSWIPVTLYCMLLFREDLYIVAWNKLVAYRRMRLMD